MHFRVRGNNVQVIKSEADASGKKKATAVGSFKKNAAELPEELKSVLSASEAKEAQAWIQFNAETNKTKLKLAALTLPEQMTDAVAWLKTADKSEASFVVDGILDAMRDLRKVLAEKV